MKNVDYKIEGTVLTIKVDMAKTFGPSKSLKTVIIATTEGNQEIAPGVKMGLTIYKNP